jgi:hypothetical protein
MTTAAPDVTVWPFTDLDAELPCDIRTVEGEPCGKPAGWVARSSVPCHKQRATSLMCDDHKDYLLTGRTWWCPACKSLYVPLNTVVEPL